MDHRITSGAAGAVAPTSHSPFQIRGAWQQKPIDRGSLGDGAEAKLLRPVCAGTPDGTAATPIGRVDSHAGFFAITRIESRGRAPLASGTGQSCGPRRGVATFGVFRMLDVNQRRRGGAQYAVSIAASIFLDIFNVFLLFLRLFCGERDRLTGDGYLDRHSTKAEVTMATELVLLGTAGAPLPVAGRGGISSAVVVDDRVFVIDCGRGSPSALVDAGLDFTQLEAIFITHLHADHVGDLPGMLLYP
ncbi:MAG: MBL fold metallo-hydrolase, partial [Solirubrobacterales bacterium]|nr:MBL fold metallo-hydrolase [Solirubrobacterales bacterium]